MVGLAPRRVFDNLLSKYTAFMQKSSPEHVTAVVFMTADPEFARVMRQAQEVCVRVCLRVC